MSIETSLDTEPVDGGTGFRYILAELVAGCRAVWEKHRFWFWIMIPYLIAWIQPTLLSWGLWQFSSPFAYQLFIPIGVFVLTWVRRKDLAEQHYQSRFLYTNESPMLRTGWVIIGLSCVLLFLSYLAGVPGLAVIALIGVGAGVVQRFFGIAVLGAMRVPFLFCLLMVPPPISLVSIANDEMCYNMTAAVGTILDRVGLKNQTVETFIRFENYTVEVTQEYSGLSILMPMLIVTLFMLLLRKAKLFYSLALLVASVAVALLMNVLRIGLTGVFAATNPSLAGFIYRIPVLLYVLLGMYFVYLIARATGLMPRRVESDE